MALTDILPSSESFSGGNDILDLSALTADISFDSSFGGLLDKNNLSNFAEVTGYENIVGGQGDDTIIGFGENPFGIVGGDGIDVLYGSELDILRYDLEEIYKRPWNEPQADTFTVKVRYRF